MAPKRIRLTKEKLMQLRTGADRDGTERTWQEVADLCGVSISYARQVADERRAKPPAKVWLDPRDIIPELTQVMSDEDVERWNMLPECLCGCTLATLQEVNNGGKVPYGAYRLFKGSHEKRMPWASIRQPGLNAELERRRRISLALRQRSISAVFIGEMVMEWRIAGHGTLRELADAAGIGEKHLREIAHRRVERITKLTAGKLLAAMGEPMRPEIAKEYRAWAKTNGRTLDIVVAR